MWMVLAAAAPALAVFADGCAVRTVTKETHTEVRPAMEATEDDLIAKYNEQARAVKTIRATVTMAPTGGSTYSGVIREYHEVNGFILAQKPAHIRVIGQAPVVSTNVFDMVSDGESFHIFIPSKNKFIVGPAAFERPSSKPIENLRPQHVLDAIFWPEIPAGGFPLLDLVDEPPERYYVLIETREGAKGPEIARKIWFDRADLSVARVQIYMASGKVASDVRYSDWQMVGGVRYPRRILMERPQDDYKLEIRITQLAVNEEITPDRFKLEQPVGTELVRVGEGGEVKQ